MTSVPVRGDRGGRHTDGGGDRVSTDAETGVMRPQAKERQLPPDLQEAGAISSRDSRGRTALPTP